MKTPILVSIVLGLSGLAATQPAMAVGFSFDYTTGGHAVSIVDQSNNHPVWSEGADPTASFSLIGNGFSFAGGNWYNTDQIRSASAASGNAAQGNMGIRANAVDPSGSLHADVQWADAHVQMGGVFIIAGPAGTVDLNVRTTLDGSIGVTLQSGINDHSLMTLNLEATSIDYNPANYFSSTTGWNIGSRYTPGDPSATGLFFNNDQISGTGSYQFVSHELTLTLAAVKTNQLFNMDLFLSTTIEGPGLYGTLGDQANFFATYGMGFANNNPQQWFELPAGYSITAAPVPEPESSAMLIAGLGLIGLMARRRKQNAA